MIVVDHVTKRYGEQTAVDDVSFACASGQVTGFLGPNGAGKSTTMRIICGLTPPTHGATSILGTPFRELPNPGREVGVLLDASAQHAGRTGREVLTLSAMVLGVPRTAVDEMLELVGLTAAAGKRVGNYSLGMRQRIGLANALLGGPDVLILDEPANGLDPEGIFWMRGLLRDFADRGGTVMLSSHLLHEVEAVADRLVVIGAGAIVADGTKEELLAGTGTLVRSLDDPALETALLARGLEVTPRFGGGFIVEAGTEAVGRAAAGAGVVLTELRSADGSGLEQLFLSLTAGAGPDAPPSRRPRRREGAVMTAGTGPVEDAAVTGREPGPRDRPRTITPSRPTAATLTTVEMRKMVDTRAGRWLLVVIAALSVVIPVIALLAGDPDGRNVRSFFQLELVPTGLLLPVLGILTVTSEWSQRTALTTFTLVPERSRILFAKLAAVALAAVASVVVSVTMAYLVNALAVTFVEADGSWALPFSAIGQAVLFQLLNVVLGVAFGLLFMNSPIAIVLYFMLPTVWQILTNTISAIQDAAAWLDFQSAVARLVDAAPITGEDWAQIATATLVWVGVPLLAGSLRLLRRELK